MSVPKFFPVFNSFVDNRIGSLTLIELRLAIILFRWRNNNDDRDPYAGLSFPSLDLIEYSLKISGAKVSRKRLNRAMRRLEEIGIILTENPGQKNAKRRLLIQHESGANSAPERSGANSIPPSGANLDNIRGQFDTGSGANSAPHSDSSSDSSEFLSFRIEKKEPSPAKVNAVELSEFQRQLRSEYPPGAARFIETYPQRAMQRKGVDEDEIVDFWIKNNLEPKAAYILLSLKHYKSSAEWNEEGGKYVYSPLEWLTKKKYRGEPGDSEETIAENKPQPGFPPRD